MTSMWIIQCLLNIFLFKIHNKITWLTLLSSSSMKSILKYCVSWIEWWRTHQQFLIYPYTDFSQNDSYWSDRSSSSMICQKCTGGRGQIKHSLVGMNAKELCIWHGRSKIAPSFLPPTHLQASQALLCPSSPAVRTCNAHIFCILHIPHL